MNPGDIKSFEMTIEQADVFSCSVEFYLPSGRQLRTDESILDPPTATP
jgi:hypothetical protein